MIQQICLTQTKKAKMINFDEPIELIINAKDYGKFKKVLKVLFDRQSIEQIKKIKAKTLRS